MTVFAIHKQNPDRVGEMDSSRLVDGDLSIQQVDKLFGSRSPVVALNNISLDVHRGELVVLLGPSGCGKTTLLRSIAGLESPTKGSISLFGRPVVDVANGLDVPSNRRNVGMVFQNYALWPHMTVRDNVAYPLRSRGAKRADARQEADQMLDLLGCGHLGDRYPSQLSGGQQQRVAVGRGLIGHPETVLFDEPLSNIDAQLRRSVRAEIRRLHKKLKFTAVWVTHDQEEGLELADRIAVMQDGQIVQLGSPSEIYDRPASAYVANFIGIENRFTIEINSEGATGDIGVLSGPWNRLAPGLSGRFEVFLRSRSLRCRPSEEHGSAVGEECRIKGGVLTDALFSGRETESIVEYGDHRLHSADAERVNQSQIGQPVTCLFDVKNAFVFPISDAHACSAVPSEGPS